ncbi:MAG: ATP-dependent helicase, partial [Lachnospiraceae bacterium]|nr:ATP-dependent helicase [Lachnospiraceae bacterium]
MLDQYQMAAVRHGSGPCLCLAGPGSGKTSTLVHRIVNLIREYHIPPHKILVVTFTRDAAAEMRSRFLSMSGSSSFVSFGTFHSICFSILKNEPAFNGMHILKAPEKRIIYRRTFSGFLDNQRDFCDYDSLEQALGLYRSGGDYAERTKRAASVLGISEDGLRKCAERYDREKKKLNAMDFDDLIELVHTRLKSDRDMLFRWRERYRYFLVDEMQDMDEKQFDIIRLLASPEDNVFAVGDDDQSIYAFRGAAPKIMLSFKDYYPEAVVYRLQRNYRSSIRVCEASVGIIKNNRIRYDKGIIPMSSSEGSVNVIECMDPREEARTVVRLIKEACNTVAVLYRNR